MKNKESWDRRQEAHDRRLRQYGPGAESAEEEQARKEAEQHSAELDKKLNEAEERSVLEEAQRREEAAARAAADAEAAKEASPQPLASWPPWTLSGTSSSAAPPAPAGERHGGGCHSRRPPRVRGNGRRSGSGIRPVYGHAAPHCRAGGGYDGG